MSTAVEVGRNVHAELVRAEMQFREVSRLLEMSEPALRRRIRGQVPFDVVELQRLSEALKIPYTRFLDPNGVLPQ